MPGFNGHHLQVLRSASVQASGEMKVRDDYGYSMASPGISSSFTDVGGATDTKVSTMTGEVMV